MQYWTELSSGYQTVKAVMERDGDVERAQRYHRYEIEARFVGIVQTLLSLILAFLFGLAVRRKFQIR